VSSAVKELSDTSDDLSDNVLETESGVALLPNGIPASGVECANDVSPLMLLLAVKVFLICLPRRVKIWLGTRYDLCRDMLLDYCYQCSCLSVSLLVCHTASLSFSVQKRMRLLWSNAVVLLDCTVMTVTSAVLSQSTVGDCHQL